MVGARSGEHRTPNTIKITIKIKIKLFLSRDGSRQVGIGRDRSSSGVIPARTISSYLDEVEGLSGAISTYLDLGRLRVGRRSYPA
jgi:hypothetical protein